MTETPKNVEDPGNAPCVRLPWDSEFFGLTVARVKAATLDARAARAVRDWAVAESVECVYFLNEPIDQVSVKAAVDAGFREIDVRVELEYRLDVGASSAHLHAHDIGPARADEETAVAAMARELHIDSRFFEDPNIQNAHARELYARWIQNSFRAPDDELLVARIDGRPAGYVACQMESDDAQRTGRIGLIGVGADAQGKGLGKALVRSSIEWFQSHGAERVRVVTQGRNKAAMGLYERAGFVPHTRGAWLHLWALRPTD